MLSHAMSIAIFIGFFLSQSLVAVEYRKATKQDLTPILDMYAIAASNEEDTKKIVIFPEPHRGTIINASLDKGRIFIATTLDSLGEEKVIGLKKAFIVPESGPERKGILQDELHLFDPLVDGFLKSSHRSCFTDADMSEDGNATFLYVGGDYTLPDFRGQKHNYNLSLETLQDEMISSILKTKEKFYVVFGVVDANVERSISILHQVEESFPAYEFQGESRYNAHMPVFDENMNFKLEEAVSGFGYAQCFERKISE